MPQFLKSSEVEIPAKKPPVRTLSSGLGVEANLVFAIERSPLAKPDGPTILGVLILFEFTAQSIRIDCVIEADASR